MGPGTNSAENATDLDPAATWQKPSTYLAVKQTLLSSGIKVTEVQ